MDLEVIPENLSVALSPSSPQASSVPEVSLTKNLSAQRLVLTKAKKALQIREDFFVPAEYFDWLKARLRQYRIWGHAYVERATYFSTIPGCRIDFFEIDRGPLTGALGRPGPISPREVFLGSAFTLPEPDDGKYEFSFYFPINSFLLAKPYPPTGISDYAPDIQARFFLFIDGQWTKVYDAPMIALDWNISTDYHRDYKIPESCVPEAPTVIRPDQGFRFNSIGLLPVDDSHISQGYATSQSHDPAPGISHQPFCGVLSIYGLFARSEDHPVTEYKVEVQRCQGLGDSLGADEEWRILTDPLTNLKFNEGSGTWEPESLNLPGGRYRNIDQEPEINWHQHALKFVWRTAGCVDGYYRLRVVGYTESGREIAAEMQKIRIDNSLPQADLTVLYPPASPCGELVLGNSRTITFGVTAYDPNGHILHYSVDGIRGPKGQQAGATITKRRPDPSGTWEGITLETEDFNIAARTGETIGCATMAYRFRLTVQGAGTDGMSAMLESRRVPREVTLVVTDNPTP